MNGKSQLIYVECPRCGFQRQVTRAEIVAGAWKRSCPVCNPPANRAAGDTTAALDAALEKVVNDVE